MLPEESMNIVRALQMEAKKLEQRLDRVRAAITALNGEGRGHKRGGYKHSAATRRKISIASKKRWAAKKGK
jgi:hypothetical protein